MLHRHRLADYDYIDRYDVTAAPNADDGSLTITVDLTWTALEELPYGQELKIGVPNGSVRDEEALTDNIERLSFDNSYMYVYLDRAYKQGETFTFSYRWVQEYMYTLSGNTVTFDYTPGWFDEARVGEMTLKWIDPAGLIGDLTAAADAGGTAAPQTGMMTITASDLGYGETMGVHAVYTDWPTVLSSDNSAVNAPNDGWYDGDEDEDTKHGRHVPDADHHHFHRLGGGADSPGAVRRLRRRLRHTVRVRQPPLVSLRDPTDAPSRQRWHQAASPPAPQRRQRLRRRQPRRWVWRRRLRRRKPLRLRQQLRLCVCLRLCRRRTCRLLRPRTCTAR